MDILRFIETPMKDESIEEYEQRCEYEPITGKNLNNREEIRIHMKRKVYSRTRVRAIWSRNGD